MQKPLRSQNKICATWALRLRKTKRCPLIGVSPNSASTSAVSPSKLLRASTGGGASADAGDEGANAAGDAADGDAADAGAAHTFGLLARAGGFGVTSGRHDERDAKTPWYLTSGIFGGGISAASRAMNSIGVMTRWVRPLRGTFSEYAILPSRSTSIRSSANGG